MKISYTTRLIILFFVLLNNNFLSNYSYASDSSLLSNQSVLDYATDIDQKLLSGSLATQDTYFTEQETLNGALLFSTIYGDFLVEDPLIIDLIKSPEIQRLKEINQYGIDYYVYKPERYTRYQHSVCVYLLTKKYGASIQEQAAALLHDVSHTIFSHSLDFLLKEDLRLDSYQDDIHDYFLQNSSIKGILERHNLTTKEVSNKNEEFKILDQSIPDLCTDRIEYNLYGGYIEGILKPSEIKTILSDLKFENGKWYFETIASARLLSYFALYLTDTRLAGYDNFARNMLFSKVLERALEICIITFEEIHASIDNDIWNRLNNCNDSIINSNLKKLMDIANHYVLDKEHYDICQYPKFRAIDPFIKTETGFFRLSELDSAFKDDYAALKNRILEGVHIKFKN